MTFNVAEKHQSQVPAVQLLVALGFTPLSQAEALTQRDGRLHVVTLDEILAEQLLQINRYTHRGRNYSFDLEDVYEAIRRLKPTPDQIKGLRGVNQDVYDMLVLGTTITKTINEDSKSFSLRYIDWENPNNNVYHVTAEMVVERTGGSKTRRLDIVAFVNGIPFIVIENKRPTENLKKASSQLIRYQNEDNIPHLFHYAQLLMTMNRQSARYATVGTEQKFWQPWRDDEDTDEIITPYANHALTDEEKDSVFSGELAQARVDFEGATTETRTVTAQDRAIFSLCRPERLLDLVRRFTVFDGSIRKIARHQQFFAVRKAIKKVKQLDTSKGREGGVIWHTQGSGKSLTMVMLGRALALEKSISNPRIIIVTDRDDLDKQIKDTFKSCEMEPKRATSGRHLGLLIRNRATLVTTIINKFSTALRDKKVVDKDFNIFVLVDESHRTQTGRHGGYGELAVQMRRILPNACYLGFTGTPLLRKEKNTFATFGGLIHRYPINEAIEDEAIVPLLYEGRLTNLQANPTIDQWFAKISEKLTDQQKADLKKKYSRMDALSKTQQAILSKALDISEHFRQHWKGTGLKAQLVAPSKAAAVRFKENLDVIGDVTSEIIISPPDDKEDNEEVGKEAEDLVLSFWKRMMDKYHTENEYNRQIIGNFKDAEDPDILIVVSKLLTGFDAPRNTVLYVCKTLREHSLLQAIARVNRLYGQKMEEKQFGFIIDYEGLLGELDKALTTYSALEDYDASDLEGTVYDIKEEIRRLPQQRNYLWDFFRQIENKNDMEKFEQFLADESVRHEFYERLHAFGRCLHISLSSNKVCQIINGDKIEEIKQDWKRFSELKKSVQLRYQEVVNIKEFEPKIQKILDACVTAGPVEVIIEPVNINDENALNKIVQETGISNASKADRIASATRKTITERMDEDPAFYRRFSELLEEAIKDYRAKRISEKDYLEKVVNLARKVAHGYSDEGIPASIRENNDGRAFFGILNNTLCDLDGKFIAPEETAEISLEVVDLIKSHLIVAIWSNKSAQDELCNALDDYCCDILRDERKIGLTDDAIDEIVFEIVRLARARFPQ